MTTYLDGIVAHHRARASRDGRDLGGLVAEAVAAPPCRGFAAAIGSRRGMAVIAEIKRRSPSRGDLNAGLDPASLARRYESGGASCLSVLTDGPHFGGSGQDLRAAKEATNLPVLRKDFTVDPRDVCDARLMGADCALLIAAVLDDAELRACIEVAERIGIDVLVEVHDEHEVSRATAVGARMIGVNQRDLATFEVDRDRAVRVASMIPPGVARVAESGIRGRADVESLRSAGYDAVLVGEHLVMSSDPAAAVRDLCLD